MREVSYDETKALLEGIVKGKEDFVYVPVGGYRCVNWTEENGDGVRTPSCIVGHVFAKLEVLDELEVGFRGWDAYGTTDMLTTSGTALFEPSAILLLARVQTKQDADIPWGRALDEAITEVEGN